MAGRIPTSRANSGTTAGMASHDRGCEVPAQRSFVLDTAVVDEVCRGGQ